MIFLPLCFASLSSSRRFFEVPNVKESALAPTFTLRTDTLEWVDNLLLNTLAFFTRLFILVEEEETASWRWIFQVAELWLVLSAAWHLHKLWISWAAAGICRLKCFCRCFCWTFRANPDPRIPWNSECEKADVTKWTYSRESKEWDGEDGEERSNNLANPSPWHSVAITNSCHCYLQQVTSNK